MPSSVERPDFTESVSQAPYNQDSNFEVRLRRVLAYIGEKRRRRLTAATAVFLLLYNVSSIPFDSLYSLVFDILEIVGMGPTDIFSPGTYGLVLLTTTSLPPLIITLVIFSRLRKAYRGY